MTELKELIEQGKLAEAIKAVTDNVRNKPNDLDSRLLLSELLCIDGGVERADKQFETVVLQDTELAPHMSLMRQLLRADQARKQFFMEGRLPEFLQDASEHTKLYLQASIAIREGNQTEAAELLEKAEEARPKRSGKCNGEPFDDFRDLDDSVAGCFEVMTSTGKFYLAPIDSVRSVTMQPIKRTIDLLWRQATVDVIDGPCGEVYLPTIYARTYVDNQDESLLFGYATDWSGDDPPITGVGQRLFLAGEQDISIREIEKIQFDDAS